MNKTDLRYTMRVKRRYFGEIVRLEADRAIAETFFEAFSNFDDYFVYNSFGDEARTDLIIGELLGSGKRVYLPRVEGGEIVPVRYLGKETPTKKGAFGICEPCGEAYSGRIDLALVPLLAVNSRGFRVGYGKGFYDRFLKGKDILKVGMGYFFQLAEFGEDACDVPMDKYLCERGIYNFDK